MLLDGARGTGAPAEPGGKYLINADWIDYWSGKYPEGADDHVLKVVGPRVRERGYYNRADLIDVGNWKSPRARPLLQSNTDDMIRDITRTAFTAPVPIQHRIVSLLSGVRRPMASALLMAWQPDQHTVIDVRAVKSLVKNGEIPDPAPEDYPPYMEYLAVCKAISKRFNRDLRKLDRALFEANGATDKP
jgi:hypothetical protein